MATAARPRRRPGLASRAALVTTTVAALAVLLAGVVSLGLVRGAAEQQARDSLHRQAAILAGLPVVVAPDQVGAETRRAGAARALQLLRQQGITVVRVDPTGLVKRVRAVEPPAPAATPDAATPDAVTPGAVTPGAVTPGAVPSGARIGGGRMCRPNCAGGGAGGTRGGDGVAVPPLDRAPGESPLDALTPADRAAVVSGTEVSAVREVRGHRVFVEALPVEGGGGIALVQRATVARGATTDVLRRTLLALLAGLAGAALAGVLLARRLARPLQHAAAAANRLAGGARDVRLEPEGPAEVAEVAHALNTLAVALESSEGRQREFLLSVSHELRTPLTGVKGFAEALADGVTELDDVQKTGAVILAEATRLERLVSDLLDLARLGRQDFRIDLAPVDLTALLDEAAVVWSSRCRDADVVFGVDSPGRPVVVRADATRVRQILDGLMENALRVTPRGAPIRIALHSDGRQAVLEVRDGGPGLTPDDCAVAFERFVLYRRYRGVRPVGTGVGLALVAGLVTRLGGTARAGRAPEGGARFTVRLPLAPDAAAAHGTAARIAATVTIG